MLGQKTILNKFKRIEVISSTFSDHNGKLENELQEDKWEKHKCMETKHMLLKHQWVKEEMKEEIRK